MDATRRILCRSARFATVPVLIAELLLPPAAPAQERDSIPGAALTAPGEIARALDPFRGDPDSAAVARLLARAQADVSFPTSPEDRVLVARLWRRAGEPELALDALPAEPPAEARALVELERARVLFEADRTYLGSAPDLETGAQAWWVACANMDDRAKRELGWDLLAASTPDEREEWTALDAGPAACEWLRSFWSERAQRMAIDTNERLGLHYRRLAVARDWYWIPRERFLDGTADWHGRPTGLAMDDRGLIFVRMGHPLTAEGFSESGAGEPGVAAAADLSSDIGIPHEGIIGGPKDEFDRAVGAERSFCWPYWRSNGYRIFCFTQHPERADNDYRLVDHVYGREGTGFFQQYIANSNLGRSARRIRRGGIRDAWERALDAAQRRTSALHRQVKTRENIDEALQAIPDVPDVFPGVALRVETLRFLNPASSRWIVWTVVSVRAGDLAPAPDPAGSSMLAAGGRFSVLGPDGVQIRDFEPLVVPADSVDEDDGITLLGMFRADPGELPLTVVVHDAHTPNSGNWYQGTINVPAVGGLPQLSDIAVAQAEGGAWTRDGQTYLQVTPAHVTNADASIHTYFEVYGVSPETKYDVEFRLAPVDVAGRIWRLEPDDLAFRLRFTAEMPGDVGRHHLELDLGDTEPGEYVLAVRIQDEDTKAYSLPSVTDVFVLEGGTAAED